jgi:hypothetical protein
MKEDITIIDIDNQGYIHEYFNREENVFEKVDA